VDERIGRAKEAQGKGGEKGGKGKWKVKENKGREGKMGWGREGGRVVCEITPLGCKVISSKNGHFC
jgi:hypothetical protein